MVHWILNPMRRCSLVDAERVVSCGFVRSCAVNTVPYVTCVLRPNFAKPRSNRAQTGPDKLSIKSSKPLSTSILGRSTPSTNLIVGSKATR